MDERHLIQGTDEWNGARVGSLGASQVHEALAKTKSGWGASRANIMAALICERLTGVQQDTYQNQEMLFGIETEPHAVAAYEFRYNQTALPCGLFRHPKISGTHASPDRLIGGDGVLECKCPKSATHLDYLLSNNIPSKYITQMMWQLACTGRKYAVFCSFDPRMPERLRLFVKRIERDDKMIADLEAEVVKFLAELSEKINQLEKVA